MTIRDLKPRVFTWNETSEDSKFLSVETQMKLSLEFYNLTGWGVDFNNRNRAAGLCSYREKKIYLSKHFVELNSFTEIEKTIKHEIAHAISFTYFKERGHGSTWSSVSISIGDDGERCYKSSEVNMPKGKVKYNCINCNKEYSFHRVIKRQYACVDCCKKLNFNKFSSLYILKLVEN